MGADPGDAKAELTQIAIDYIKSNAFRVVHADGAVGGLNPRGNLHISFYNERMPIPQQVTHSVEGRALKEEIGRVQRDAVVREVEVDVHMTVGNAKSLVTWLQGKIDEYERVKQEEQRQTKKKKAKGTNGKKK